MTDILVNWLNDDVKLSKKVTAATFAYEFANGYLIGEVLSKHHLQDDFDKFSQARTSESRLNNFIRVEPILALLGIPFDTSIARDIMTEKHGVATKVMYQLFIALSRKEKAGLTGTAMETMKPAAPAKLAYMKGLIYKERLKHLTPRQADLNLQALVDEYQQKQVKVEQTAFRLQLEEEERIKQDVQKRRLELMEKQRRAQALMSERIAKIHAAKVAIPHPPERTLELMAERRARRHGDEIESTRDDIERFEAKLAATLPPSKPFDDSDVETVLQTADVTEAGGDDDDGATAAIDDSGLVNELDFILPKSNDAYISKVRKRLQEDASARNEREKRRRKVLVEQQRAHDAQEDARREEVLVNRLMRQSQQERRIAVQLMQARHEKDTLRSNRLFREQQYEQRRLKEFEDALNREAELARLAQLQYADETRRNQEVHARVAAERAEARYRKRYELCEDALMAIVDVACKVGEYRELTGKLLPQKMWTDWRALFTSCQPLYLPSAEAAAAAAALQPADVLEQERQAVLDEVDFTEYREMTGQWAPSDVQNAEIAGVPANNAVLGHIIGRIFNMVHPPMPPPEAPNFQPFPIKACLLGKPFSGKSSVAARLAESHRLKVLDVDTLVEEAIKAHTDNESADQGRGSNLPAAKKGSRMADIGDASLKADDEESGAEKTDAEKPVESLKQAKPTPKKGRKSLAADNAADQSAAAKSELSARAKLGGKAVRLLKKGKPVDDQLIVDILVEEIRQIAEGTGWLLDDFPTTYNQAKLLEKALSGFDIEADGKQKALGKEGKDGKGSSTKLRGSRLAPDPKPVPQALEPTSAINVAILFDVPDEVCLKRSTGRFVGLRSQEPYHQEFKPPPEGSMTGMQNQEMVGPVSDPAYDREQIQNRITGFIENYPKVGKWFSKIGVMRKIDGTLDHTALYLETESILEDTIDRLLQRGKYKPQPEPEPPVEPPPPEPVAVEAPATLQVPAVELPKPDSRPSSRSSKKGSRAGSPKKAGSRKASPGKKREESESPKRKGGSAEKKSRSSSGGKKSPGRKSKKGKTPEPEPEPEKPPEEPTGPLPPAPGAPDYVYVEDPLPETLASVLASHWEVVENTYIDASKVVFRDVRAEREKVIKYFYKVRKDYIEYLRRPDHKQEFVDQYQAEYNSVPDDMREDEETRAELHERVDDLRERLWSICDDRKESAEKERLDIVNDGWLDDRLGVVSNLHITLMQAEVDRFQDTIQLLKDYYKGMEGPIPDEAKSQYARLPLIELPETGRPDSARSTSEPPPVSRDATTAAAAAAGGAAAGGERVTTPKPRSSTPQGKKKKKGSARGSRKSVTPPPTPPPQPAPPEGRRIPLIQRKRGDAVVEPEPVAAVTPAKGDKKDKKGKKGQPAAATEEKSSESPSVLAQMDPDERLLFECYDNGLRAIVFLVQQEEAARKAAEDAENEAAIAAALQEKDKSVKAPDKKGAAAAGAKKGKSRSPSPKKGGKKDKAAVSEPTPPPQPVEETEEEKERKLKKTKARDEFMAAVKSEESACRSRLTLVKAVAIKVLQELKGKADGVYKDMNDWLGARFLKEMESIDHMSEIARHAIEARERIAKQLLLQQEDFLVAEDVKTVRTPSPKQRPQPAELPHPEYFSVDQLLSLYTQFALIAPDGVLSIKSFIDIFQEFTSLTHGMELLPDAWMNVTVGQLQELAAMLSLDAEYMNWRTFMAAVAQPIDLPTLDELMDTLQRFQEMDQKGTGYVTREQYDRTELWFKMDRPVTPDDPSAPYAYNRMENLKKALFDIFANHTGTPSKLFYKDMLMFFSGAPDAYDGFVRALSVTSGAKIAPDEAKHEHVTVAMDAVYKVLHHGEGDQTDSNRFSIPPHDPEDVLTKDKLAMVYAELGGSETSPVLFDSLMMHPIIDEFVQGFARFRQADVFGLLNSAPQTAGEGSDGTFG